MSFLAYVLNLINGYVVVSLTKQQTTDDVEPVVARVKNSDESAEGGEMEAMMNH